MTVYEFIIEHRIGIIIVMCLVSWLFICVGHIYRDEIQLKLKRKFATFPEAEIDWWSVSHLLFYGIIGFLIPDYPLSFFVLGAGFELLEDCLSADKTTQLANCMNPKTKKSNFICWGSVQDDYWYMNPTDPWVNLTGYVIGSAVRTVLVGV